MIHILMATYNGAKYIREQIDSILEQTQSEWMLHICDDTSQDDTVPIIYEYMKKYPDKITFTQNEKNRGSKQTFFRLLREIQEEGDYAFCDQDDIWEENKLEVMQEAMRKAEKEKKEPILMYADACVVDDKGNTTGESFVTQTGVFLSEDRFFERLLSCNCVQGAASMWNYELHKCIKEVPKDALMHDWWLALVAEGQGRIIYLPQKLTRYRQHESNVIGGFDRKAWHKTFLSKLKISNWRQLKENNAALKRERKAQAQAYYDMYCDERAKVYCEILAKKNPLSRTYLGIHKGYLFMSKKYSVKYYFL